MRNITFVMSFVMICVILLYFTCFKITTHFDNYKLISGKSEVRQSIKKMIRI